MSNDLLASKTIIFEGAPKIRGVQPQATSVASAIGITERGPIGVPTLVTSFEEFQKKFGGFTANADLTLAAMGFFANGGSQLWVVRTVHYGDVSDPETATAARASGALTVSNVAAPAIVTGTNPGPFSVDNGAQFAISVNGDPEQLFTLDASAAQVSAPFPASPISLTDGDTLELRIDDGPLQTLVFNTDDFDDILDIKLNLLLVVINEKLAGGRCFRDDTAMEIYLESDTEGAGSRVEVVGGTANAVIGFPTTPANGTGYAQDIKNVSIAEVQALVAGLPLPVELFETPTGTAELRTVAT
ncbi:MAG: hypothetical protein GY854_10715 [Deltaproteobacteria bacterium]|nr:hypothetical protein [Deltaproteobacteria bacterium]